MTFLSSNIRCMSLCVFFNLKIENCFTNHDILFPFSFYGTSQFFGKCTLYLAIKPLSTNSLFTAVLQELVTELHMQSIFTDVGKLSLQDPTHSAIIPSVAGQTGSPITSTAWLSQSGEAHYALASPTGGILVVTMPPHDTPGKEHPFGATGSICWNQRPGFMFLSCRGVVFLGRLLRWQLVMPVTTDSFYMCLCGRWRVGPGAEEELHDAEIVWLDAHSYPWGAQSC